MARRAKARVAAKPRVPKQPKRTEDYRHPEKRTNNPEAGLQSFDRAVPKKVRYQYDPHLDPQLVWDGKDDSLTREPEQIKAYRDTWTLGVHSCLTYLRDRVLLARELLAEGGSIFVQIGEENVHHVRELLDEVFEAQNLAGLIPFRKKTMPLGSALLERMGDYLVWYGRNLDATKKKYHQLYRRMNVSADFHWNWY